MKYFIDTEFIEGFKNPWFGKRRHFIDLISIGIVAEDGREFYAVSTEFDEEDANDWVKENVISKLYDDEGNRLHPERWMSNKQIVNELYEFIYPGEIGNTFRDQKIKFYGYFPSYDWVVFCALFGTMMDLPDEYPKFCRDIKQMMEERGLDSAWKDKYCPAPENNHDALADARWHKQIYDRVKYIQPKQKYV